VNQYCFPGSILPAGMKQIAQNRRIMGHVFSVDTWEKWP
jgi:hypothetical protein